MSVYMSEYYTAQAQDTVQAQATTPAQSAKPAVAADGINWPYDPTSKIPDPGINWNSNPPPTAQQIIAAYASFSNWLSANPNSYNGYIAYLQFTVDIGEHLGSFSSAGQADIKSALAHQFSGSNQTLLELIIEKAAQGAAVAHPAYDENGALNDAETFLSQLWSATDSLTNIPPFSDIYNTAIQYSSRSSNPNNISNWVKAHWLQVTVPGISNTYTWVDDNGNPMSYQDFVGQSTLKMGTFIDSPDYGKVIDDYYQQQIAMLVAEIHDPMELLAALMNLINQRDQNNGQDVNGYGNNLKTLQTANGLVEDMLGDISGTVTTTSAADFFSKMKELQSLVEQNPALQSLVTQLQSDIGTINDQSTVGLIQGDYYYSIGSSGYYTFPPDTKVSFTLNNKKTQFISGNGPVYLPAGTIVDIKAADVPAKGFTFGQLAAMGDTQVLSNVMQKWSSTIMSNFENGVTGIQTLLNGASPAIQQQIQNTTQTMQAEENFEKEAYDTIININQQILKLIQQVMG
jgi:hypothetical protein